MMQAKRQTIEVSKYRSIEVSKYRSIQVSKYPGAKCDPRAVPDSHDAVCCAGSHVQLLWAPYVDSPRVPLRCFPGYPPGVDRAAACMIRVWAVFRIICPWVMSGSVTIWVPYMRRVIGSFRVVLQGIIVLLLFFFIHIPTPWDLTPGYPLGGLLG